MSRRQRKVLEGAAKLALLAIGAISSTGCSSDYWVRFSIVTDADPSVVVDQDNVLMPLGQAVAVRALPMKDDERLDSDTNVELKSLRPDLLGVDRAARTDEFVLFGSKVGQTEIDVFFEAEWVDTIPAAVVDVD